MKIAAQIEPDMLDANERAKLRGYGHLAKHLYPGAVGELLAREFEAWAEFGHRLAGDGLLLRVARDLEAEAHTRIRQGAQNVPTPWKPRSAPTTPTPLRTSVRDALRAASDAIAGRPLP